ncbi:MAG: glycosyltransferase [Solirubrobacterales bacterium]
MTRTSVIIPTRDAGPLLAEVLAAVTSEGPDEILVVDSGSTDDSVAVALEAGARVVEIAPEEVGHGRTRNLAAKESTGDLVIFLTQDATPTQGWLRSYVDLFDAEPGVGAAFGPHIPPPSTSPMISRELVEFFSSFSPDDKPSFQSADGSTGSSEPFLSNANSAYRREVLEEIGFRDLSYAEDQAFGRDLLDAGWKKAYVPGAAVLHAHDYGPAGFVQRYFDEYRGLRESVGHVERVRPLRDARDVARQVAADYRWLRRSGSPPAASSRVLGRSAIHHGGRKLAAAAGSRAPDLPATLQRWASLEGTVSDGGLDGQGSSSPVVAGRPIPPRRERELYWELLDLDHKGPAELLPPISGMSESPSLHIAIVVPPFHKGSGGHDTIFRIFRHIEEMGHTCSVWITDPMRKMKGEWPAVIRQRIRDEFVELDAPVFKEFGDWYGADIALATGWETVAPVVQLPNCRARAYFVQDHEPGFFPASAESNWAELSYQQGLFAICASPWLAELMSKRYGADTSVFQLGVDPGVYFPRDVERRRDTIAFYGRATTGRRAVPLAMLALAELSRRRPETRIVAYGDRYPLESTFPYEWLGVADQETLATLYSEATVGLCLSVTNYSRAPQEMMACGLPCVDLAGFSAETVFGEDGPVELSAFSPVALADRVEELMDDRGLWERRSLEGIEFAAEHTWRAAAREVESGLREALRRREETLT